MDAQTNCQLIRSAKVMQTRFWSSCVRSCRGRVLLRATQSLQYQSKSCVDVLSTKSGVFSESIGQSQQICALSPVQFVFTSEFQGTYEMWRIAVMVSLGLYLCCWQMVISSTHWDDLQPDRVEIKVSTLLESSGLLLLSFEWITAQRF